MIGREKRVLLRHYLEQGIPKAEIARHLKISRRTVYNWIEAGQLDRGAGSKALRYGPRPRRPSKLDPYKGIIDARLAEYPKLSAVRLFNEVQAAGYGGGYGQVDFADFRLPWGKRHALIVVLGYSRRMWLKFYERQTMPVVMRGLEASFLLLRRRAVGAAVRPDEGRHHRRQAAEGGRLVENPEFLRFSRHWRFRIRSCRPYRAQTKGKVERPIRYIRDNFFYGQEFRVRRRPQRADPAVARWRGERSDPRYAEGARGGSVRPREVVLESLGSLALPSRGAAARALDETDRGTLDTPRRGR